MERSSFRGSTLVILFLLCLSMVAFPPIVFSAQIRIAWNANGEADLEGYRVYWGTASRTYGTPVDVGNATTYTIPNLTAGQTYYVSVTAHDTAQNNSGYSNEVSGVATDPVQTYSYTVTTNPSELQVSVDGTTYTAPQTFTWSSGSSHTLSSASPQSGSTGVRYAFASWSDGGGQAHTITAPSSATTYTASFTTQYSLTTTASPSAGGTVTPSGTGWYNSGQSVSVSATANAGYSFSGWSVDLTGPTSPANITMNSPKNVTATFTAITETVSTPTTPSGPASGTTGTSYSYTTGGSTSNLGHTVQYQFDWKGDGTDLSAWGPSPQSKTWTAAGTCNVRARARCTTHTSIVSAWSNGLSVTVAAAPVSITVTTNPSGLEVTVDSTNYTAPRTFPWAPGSSHTVSVSSPQNGTSGTRYAYASWSDGGGQTHTITAPSSATTYTASLTTQYSLTTTASPSAGGTVTPPGTSWYNSGQSVSVSATANTGYNFSGWSVDLTGPTSPANITMNSPKNVTATFTAITETVSTPTTPSGPTSGTTGTSYSYTTGGSTSNLGHTVQYQFDWKGDGTDLSTWGSSPQSKTWTAAGTCNVRARARCASHTSVESAWSSSVAVVITQPSSAITVTTSPGGLQVAVDGTTYTAPRSFNWTPGSSHTLSVSSPQLGGAGTTRYVFSSWSDSGAQTHTITAPSSATTYTATLNTEYSLATSSSPAGGGTITPAGTAWYAAGASVTLTATPTVEYHFTGWSGDLTGASNPASLTMGGPKSITGNFATTTETVSVPSTPSGQTSGSSGTPYAYTTGGSASNLGHTVEYQFDWKGDATDLSVWGSATQTKTWTSGGTYSVRARARCATHSGVTSPWSNSLPVTIIGAETVSAPSTPSGPGSGSTGVSYSYSTGGATSSLGDPVEYQFDWKGDTTDLSVWGTSNQSKTWTAVGTYNVRARARCTTHTTVVSSWSATLTVNIAPGTVAYTVTTSLAGLQIMVDGSTYAAPRTFNWTAGSSHTLSVPSPQSGPVGTRYVFGTWSDGGALTHTISTPSSATTYTASFTMQHSLTASVAPSGAGTVSPSGTNWYPNNEVVSLSVTPGSGYSFSGWTGDLTGADNPGSLTMNGPKTVAANFATVTETVSTPPVPAGPASGNSNVSYSYTVGSSSSNLGHTVQYQFDWKGDGTDLSSWGSATQSKIWTVNATYNVRARSRCSIDTGVISSWSGSLPVTIGPAGNSSYSYTVTTNPSGLQMTVDGVNYVAPRTFSWAAGSIHTLSVPSPQSGGTGTQYVYASWSDGGAQTHTITTPSESATYSATLDTQYSLVTTAATPAGGEVDPAGTKWFKRGAVATVLAEPNPGYAFSGWSGALRGTVNPGSIAMSGPKKVKAGFKQSKYSLQVSRDALTLGSVSKSPNKSKYVYGEQVTLTAKPKPGHVFTEWSGDVTGTENPITVTMKKNMSVRPNFVKQGAAQTVALEVLPQTVETADLSLTGLLESPADGKAVSGVKALYGWALDGDGISRVELLIDGQYVCDIPYGSRREDIRAAYADYPDSGESGFAMVMNYGNLGTGQHLISVRVHSVGGEVIDLKSRVWVTRFHGDLVTATSPSEWLIPGVEVTVDGVTKSYDLKLEWSDETQSLELSEIVGK